MHAYARSISTIWLVNTPLSALGLVLVVFIRAYSLHRVVIRDGAEKTGDPEKGEAVVEASDKVGFTGVETPTNDDATKQTPPSLRGETPGEASTR